MTAQPRLLAALACSVLLHAAVLFAPGAHLRVSGQHAGARLEAHLSSPGQPRPPAARPPSPSIPTVASPPARDVARRPLPPAIASPAPSAVVHDANPLASPEPGELHVRELMPEDVSTPIDLADPTIPWRDAGELTRRAFALDPLDLQLPPLGLWRQPEQGVRIAVRITERGEVHGVQLLTPPSPLDDVLLDAMRNMHFTPGEVRGRPVPSILLLEFSLPR